MVINYVEKFNEIFQELLQDLIKVFPNDTDLRTYLFAVKGAMMVNEFIICKVFHSHLMVYESQVMEKDETFFLDKDYSEFHSNKVDIRTLVHKLKTCWTLLTEENKETLWKYFRVLMILANKIYA